MNASIIKQGTEFLFNGKKGRVGMCQSPDEENPTYRVFIQGSSIQYLEESKLRQLLNKPLASG